MSQTAVLVWLSAASLLPTFRADLTSYAQSRLLRLEAPLENVPAFHAAAYAPDLVAQIEVLLEEARSATASLEQSRALSALEHVERLLRDHPELPQAAWLMAEELELMAEVESSAPDGSGAAMTLQRRAAVLEGPRVTPFSDHPASSELPAPVRHALTLEGTEPDDVVEWDGEHAGAELSIAAGEHHARVSRHGRLLWAGWVAVAESDVRVRLEVPATAPCSPDDIGAGRFENGRALPAPRVRCESYVLARQHAGGGIEAALCSKESCGNVVIYQYVPARAGVTVTSERTWPRWATYTIVAAAGARATGVVLWRAGVFDKPAPQTSTVWTYMGQEKPMGFRF
ncbi:MAG TPA: hypothetical protein VHV51_12025 [Polyangiaceae bacterium]|nr:hypothetical protein [Polyangiaceae bacterium]